MPSVFLLRRQPSLQKAHEALAGMAAWRVCGGAERMREAGLAIARQAPDIVACDLRLPDGHAGRLALQLRQWPQRPQLLLLSPTADDLGLFDALLVGASGYCVDAGDGRGLLTGLSQLAAGRATMSPAIARQVLDRFGLGRSSLTEARSPGAADDLAPMRMGLPRAEQHLLSLLAHGLLNTEIAACWKLEPAEIERRLWRVYPRLHGLLSA